MKTRLLSALLVFLLVTSVSVPAVSAEAMQAYYELHNMCICNAKEDLGHIPYLNWGIGYKARCIDEQNDKWEIFVHAGIATKKIIITPETPDGTVVTLMNFVNAVKECKTESDQLSIDIIAALGAGMAGSGETLKGALTDDALSTILGAGGIAASVEETHQFVIHFNSAKTAQKTAETLFDEL